MTTIVRVSLSFKFIDDREKEFYLYSSVWTVNFCMVGLLEGLFCTTGTLDGNFCTNGTLDQFF